ncbi:PAS domain S-box protein [Maridesulfovibrio sp. FT414]|uniref:PAS domain-containing hybrid sensor histidine kinase/response regulator n=1 Tax=Maridesulfovibrio sp. FT414 TaxID=2979469 RepID=UPI003D805B54
MHDSLELKQALSQSEAKFRMLFDAIEDAVIMYEIMPDGSRGLIRDVNRATCLRLGYTREEMLAMTVMDLDGPKSMACSTPVNSRYCDGAVLFETCHLAKNGTCIPVEINAKRLEYDGKPMVLAICRDITTRKQTEKDQEEYRSLLEHEVAEQTSAIKEINANLLKQIEEKEEAEAKAWRAEKSLRGLIDASNQSIFMITPEGTILYANETVASVLKSSPKAMVGTNLYDYLPEELANSRRKNINRAVTSGQRIQYRDKRDGCHIFHTVHPIKEDNKVTRLAVYAENLSNFLMKERELEHSLHVRSVLYEIISHSQSSDGIESLLKSIHQIMIKELQAENFYVALIDEERNQLVFEYCIDKKASSCPTVFNINDPDNKCLSLLPVRENRIILHTRDELVGMQKENRIEIDGPMPEVWLGVPMKVRGKPIGVLQIQEYDNPRNYSEEDIQLFAACSDQLAIAIERKKYDSAIKESEAQFRALFENNHSVMFIIDPMTGNILDTNRAAENMYGLSRDELRSISVHSLNTLAPDEVDAAMRRAKERNQKSFIFKHKISNGAIRDVEVFSGPFQFKGQTKLISIVHDITDRLRNERELSKAKEEAVAANKAKDEFLANISHEIRTPLNGVMGMLQLLQRSSINEEDRNCVNVALHSSRNLLRMLDDILDLSKMEVGTLDLIEGPFTLDCLKDECMSLFEMQAREKQLNLDCSMSQHAEGWYIGDEGRIRQILFNILGNAIKFTDSGSVSLEITISEDTGAQKPTLHFRVTDTGVGIPADKIESIFDSFTQVDGSLSRRFKGAGLGLSIVKRLISLMGGTINVESSLGMGTTVNVALPLERTDEKISQRYTSRRIITPPPLRIMLVEDERVNRMMACRILEKMGHHIICAENGQDCLNRLGTEQLDMILMDIQMPVMDGLETTRLIRNDDAYMEFRNIPIIALSAHAHDRNRRTAEDAGMDGYISKPFEWALLERTLGEVFAASETAKLLT